MNGLNEQQPAFPCTWHCATAGRLEIPQGHINYVRTGTGTPLVFLHNGGGFWELWEKQIRFFSPSYDCIAFDWPGFGKSTTKKPEQLTLDFYTNCLHEVLNRLNIEKCMLVGNCIGASVALNYQQQYPDRILKLILFNLCPGRRIFPNSFVSFMIRNISKNNVLRNTGVSLLSFFIRRKPMKNKSPRVLFGNKFHTADPLVQLYIERFKSPALARSRALLLFGVDSYTLSHFLKPQPAAENIYLFWGTENKVTGFEKDGRYHRQLIGLDKIYAVENSGHVCMYESAETVNEQLQEILA